MKEYIQNIVLFSFELDWANLKYDYAYNTVMKECSYIEGYSKEGKEWVVCNYIDGFGAVPIRLLQNPIVVASRSRNGLIPRKIDFSIFSSFGEDLRDKLIANIRKFEMDVN